MAKRPRFRDYFQDELEYLLDRSREFATAHSDIAADLHLSDLQDPDVAMLLKGFAFLTGRIRQNLDAQFPELLYPLLGQIWPHALRPTPTMSVVEFRPRPGFGAPALVERHTRVKTVPTGKTVGWFTTAYPVRVLPFRIDIPEADAQPRRVDRPPVYLGTKELRLRLKILTGAKLVAEKDGQRVEQPLRLHLRGLPRQKYGLYGLLGQTTQERPLRAIHLRMLDAAGNEIASRTLPPDKLRSLGFTPEETLLPYQQNTRKEEQRAMEEPNLTFPLYRHLHEYLFFPTKYLFFDLDFDGFLLASPLGDRLEIVFELDPEAIGGLTLAENPADNIRLHATPVVNLFRQSVTRALDQRHAEYLIRPDGDPEHHDIFAVVGVAGHLQKSRQPILYEPFFSFRNRREKRLYQVHPRERVSNDERRRTSGYRAVDTYISFIESEDARQDELPIAASVDLLVTNRDLFSERSEAIFDKSYVIAGMDVIGLGELSSAAAVPLGRDGLWRFFAHAMMGMDQLRDADALRALIELYHLPSWDNARERTQIEPLLRAIVKLDVTPDSRVLKVEADLPPVLVRGTHLRIGMADEQLGRGALALFGAVLNHHLAETASINTYTRLTIDSHSGGSLTWPPRTGTQRLI